MQQSYEEANLKINELVIISITSVTTVFSSRPRVPVYSCPAAVTPAERERRGPKPYQQPPGHQSSSAVSPLWSLHFSPVRGRHTRTTPSTHKPEPVPRSDMNDWVIIPPSCIYSSGLLSCSKGRACRCCCPLRCSHCCCPGPWDRRGWSGNLSGLLQGWSWAGSRGGKTPSGADRVAELPWLCDPSAYWKWHQRQTILG